MCVIPRQDEGLEFPILLDPGNAISISYGLLNEDNPIVPHPTAIVIDTQGVIRYCPMLFGSSAAGKSGATPDSAALPGAWPQVTVSSGLRSGFDGSESAGEGLGSKAISSKQAGQCNSLVSFGVSCVPQEGQIMMIYDRVIPSGAQATGGKKKRFGFCWNQTDRDG